MFSWQLLQPITCCHSSLTLEFYFDCFFAKSKAVNNLVTDCDKSFHHEEKEQKIGINSVPAENTITSPPPPKDIVKEDEDNCQERQLSKASVIASEKKADRYVAEFKAVNNSTNNCDEALNK